MLLKSSLQADIRIIRAVVMQVLAMQVATIQIPAIRVAIMRIAEKIRLAIPLSCQNLKKFVFLILAMVGLASI